VCTQNRARRLSWIIIEKIKTKQRIFNERKYPHLQSIWLEVERTLYKFFRPSNQPNLSGPRSPRGKFVSQREELKPEISSEKFLQLVRELEEMNKLGYRLYGLPR